MSWLEATQFINKTIPDGERDPLFQPTVFLYDGHAQKMNIQTSTRAHFLTHSICNCKDCGLQLLTAHQTLRFKVATCAFLEQTTGFASKARNGNGNSSLTGKEAYFPFQC
ncbi:hypothetical protein KIL84_021572 [Mauremys mutica]|uniref:Uncharacterized protein n=1 Tax=Mauremys mutica TaxID=74926 RepID=A0A9D3X8X4_9SAUR|nr:hypothetical protein KIL84_021572 [Mauremys mutica]